MSQVNLKFCAHVTEVIKAIERHTGIRDPVIEDSADATGLLNALIEVAGHGSYIEARCTLVDDAVVI